MNTMTRAARHVATTAGPAEQTLQEQVYWNATPASSRNRRLEQAARFLLRLQFPLSSPEQTRLSVLLERRLRRVYAEGGA